MLCAYKHKKTIIIRPSCFAVYSLFLLNVEKKIPATNGANVQKTEWALTIAVNVVKLTQTVPIAVEMIYSVLHKMLDALHAIIHTRNNLGLIVTQSVTPRCVVTSAVSWMLLFQCHGAIPLQYPSACCSPPSWIYVDEFACCSWERYCLKQIIVLRCNERAGEGGQIDHFSCLHTNFEQMDRM